LRLFAGQADPTDSAHFTIVYTLDGQPGTIDGWLRDAGAWVPKSDPNWRWETVELKVRDGPLVNLAFTN
jgi:hypothetical protein